MTSIARETLKWRLSQQTWAGTRMFKISLGCCQAMHQTLAAKSGEHLHVLDLEVGCTGTWSWREETGRASYGSTPSPLLVGAEKVNNVVIPI